MIEGIELSLTFTVFLMLLLLLLSLTFQMEVVDVKIVEKVNFTNTSKNLTQPIPVIENHKCFFKAWRRIK